MTNEYGAVLDRNGYADSIVPDGSRCYYCGRRDRALHRHEVFHGPNREKSKALGLWVPLCDLCHDRLHRVGGGLDRELKERLQRAAMDYYDWDEDDFRAVVGKNYL